MSVSISDLDKLKHIDIPASLKESTSLIFNTLGDSSDIVIRNISITEDHAKISVCIMQIEGLADEQRVSESVIAPLTALQAGQSGNNLSTIVQALTTTSLSHANTLNVALSELLSGNTLIILDDCSTILSAGTRGPETRSISEPTTQTVIRGPKDGFTESLNTNIALVRDRMKTPQLRVRSKKIGSVTQTNLAYMYLANMVDQAVLHDLEEKLNQIHINGILESAYIEALIKDKNPTVFPLMMNTERPDVVTANLLDGKVAILIQGTPYVLLIPSVFLQFFQSPEDYYQNAYIGSFLRLLRFAAFIMALYAPAVYVALISHHESLVPTVLLVSLASQREGVPFPVIVEALLMELAFEILREAGIRMPRAVGSALSIVGALILGQAAVQAGFVSAAIVIIVSLTAIASFAMPHYNMAISARLLRFILLLAGSYFGLYGIMLATIIIVLHMCGLHSFGVPYFTPMSPFQWKKQKDAFLRFSLIANNSNKNEGGPAK
ncbi:spore germination protein [Fictibacillus iocasae]|uniref:Spore germination protein n=1 Tax=Fictibacillus iocasae TaxID=2715437 RepID=A0ABW2NQB2_9BACL